MSITIVAEHFELPDYVRTHAQEAIEGIGGLLEHASSIRLHLKKHPRHGFEATLAVHSPKEDLVYHESHDHLDTLVRHLRENVKRQLVEQKQRRVDRRRHVKTQEPVSI